MTIHWDQRFSTTYAQARQRFLAAAAARGLAVETHVLPLPGVDGETLAMDVVLDGDPDAPHLVMTTSACHGIEGYCGSALQTGLLAGGDGVVPAGGGVGVLHVHALNPHGFSFGRRVTQENVDLNRNFVDFNAPLAVNAGYVELARALVPAQWPPTPENEQLLADFVARKGPMALQTAISAGQHDDPEGLFFAGRNPSWSHVTWRHVLQQHATRCAKLAWIDLHTGLGPSGHGERIFSARDDAATLARARAWWGAQVTSIYDGSSTSAKLSGMAFEAVYGECPQAEYTGIAMEYGTLPLNDVMFALRADQWLENHPETDDAQRRTIKRQTRDAFYTDTPAWKQQVVEQAHEAALQAVKGLAA
jgi:hypothetical protein